MADNNNKKASRLVRPPLKWAGSKFQILAEVKRRLPKKATRLVEPFVGSGAVFLNTDYDEYLLNDANRDLINFYLALKEYREEFINYSRQLFIPENNNAASYYLFREIFNKTSDVYLKSALFLYINKHGYNGLCRYNASGGLNVPFGRYKKPYFPEKEMVYFLKRAERAVFTHNDFSETFRQAQSHDVFYCDPPYVTLSGTANFTAYSAGGFGMDEQRKLAELAEKAANQGVPVVISNHYTKFTREVYQNARKYQVKVRRLISCNGGRREMASEVIAVFAAKNRGKIK